MKKIKEDEITTLESYCNSLSDNRKLELNIQLIKIALPVWNNYTEKHKLTYRDSVTRSKHNVDKNLLAEVIKVADEISNKPDEPINAGVEKRIKSLCNNFIDPIVALQDDDWKLPEPAEKIFYSAYNLLNAITSVNIERANYYFISINQVIEIIDSEKILNEEEIKSIMKNYIAE